MKKDELLSSLREAIRSEESASAIFLEHLHALTERVGIKEQLAEGARMTLEHLIRENKRHRAVLEDLHKRVEGAGRDDW